MQRSKFIMRFSCVLGLAGLFCGAGPTFAQDSEITAGDVVDRATLQAFVLRAKSVVEGFTSLAEALGSFDTFRAEGEWSKGSVYLFVFTTTGLGIFHGADESLEGQNLIDLEDINGVKIVQELISAAAAGGGFVEYFFDNPAVDGDEENGSPKVSYAAPLNVLGQELMIGSGFYPASDEITAVEHTAWGQLKSGFK